SLEFIKRGTTALGESAELPWGETDHERGVPLPDVDRRSSESSKRCVFVPSPGRQGRGLETSGPTNCRSSNLGGGGDERPRVSFLFRKAYSEWLEDKKLLAKDSLGKANAAKALQELEQAYARDLPSYPI